MTSTVTDGTERVRSRGYARYIASNLGRNSSLTTEMSKDEKIVNIRHIHKWLTRVKHRGGVHENEAYEAL